MEGIKFASGHYCTRYHPTLSLLLLIFLHFIPYLFRNALTVLCSLLEREVSLVNDCSKYRLILPTSLSTRYCIPSYGM